MRKITVALLALLLVVSAVWTGAWFYGKGVIVDEIEAQVARAGERGAVLSYEDVEVAGFPFGYTTRVVGPTGRFVQAMSSPLPDAGPLETVYEWSAPWVEARVALPSPNTARIRIPPVQEIVVTAPAMGDMPAEVFPVTVEAEDMVVVATRGAEDIDFDTRTPRLAMRMTVAPGEGDGSGGAEVAYAMLDMTVAGSMPQDWEGESPLPLAATYTIASTDMTMDIEGGAAAPPMTVALRGGRMEGAMDWRGAAMTGEVSAEDTAITVKSPAFGDAPLDIGIARIAGRSLMPAAAAPEAQPFAYATTVEGVTLSDGIWAMLDPEGAFSRDIERVTVDISGDAVFRALPSDPEAFVAASPGGFPIEVGTVRIDALELDALGLGVTGEGSGDLSGGTPVGTATVAMTGFADFMNALVKSGRIPPQQAMVVQLMVESFGRMDGDGETVRFDMEARDGMIYVNGIPVGEAPTTR